MKLKKTKKGHSILMGVGAAFGLLAAFGVIASLPDIIRYYRISTM